MSTTHVLKDIEGLAGKFNNDLELVSKELKSVQSKKCRLKKQRRTATWTKEMNELVAYEEALKEVRQLLNPKEKPVTRYEQADVDKLDFDETIKALKSIQSKKCLSRWLTDTEGDNDEYRSACAIEAMLIEHKKTLQPVDSDLYIRKTDLQTVIDTIESSGNLSQSKIIELLNNLM